MSAHVLLNLLNKYSKTCVKQPPSKTKNWHSSQLSLNAGQKYCILQYFDLH